MRRFFAFLLGIAAGLALVRVLRRRRASLSEPALSDPRAEELARKLAETRSSGASAETVAEGAETEASAPTGEEIDEARRRVHEDARDAVEEMRRSGGSSPRE